MLLKVFNQCFCILQVCNWFPTVFLWAPMLPSNQILCLIPHSAFLQNLLHFILQFSFNNFRSLCCRWRTIPSLEQRGMKHRMHLHGRWKDEAVWHSQRLFHCKRAYHWCDKHAGREWQNSPKRQTRAILAKKNYSAPKFAPKSPEQSIIQFLVCCTHNTASYDKASSINCGFFISSSSEFSTVKTLHMIYLHLRLYFVFYSTKDI